MIFALTDRLQELVRRKHACVSQLFALGQQQCEVVDGGDVNDLLRILGAKQVLIGTLQEIEKLLEPYRHDDPESRSWRSPADRETCAQLVAQCDLLYRALLENERRSEQRLSARRDDAAARLYEVHAAHEVRGAYFPAPLENHGTLDLMSEA